MRELAVRLGISPSFVLADRSADGARGCPIWFAGMCRLFGMSAGDEAVRATFWLLGARDSLRAQSHQNADGTGIGYFDPDGPPRVDKQPIAAFEDRRFATEARQICSRTFVAHVRHATNGALTMANTHPFCERDRPVATAPACTAKPPATVRLSWSPASRWTRTRMARGSERRAAARRPLANARIRDPVGRPTRTPGVAGRPS
jgi:hypothetical protein